MDLWAVVSVVVTALFSAGSLIGAIAANRHAANSAQAAAVSSTQAQRANELVQLQSDRSVESWIVDWHVKWDGSKGEIAFTHIGKNPAHSTFVIIRGGEDGDLYDGYGTVERDDVIKIAQPNFIETRKVENPRERDRVQQNALRGIYGIATPYSRDLIITVHWRTGLDRPEEMQWSLEIS
jgi:hypothetical protein